MPMVSKPPYPNALRSPAILTMTQPLPTIFVSIASYRDPECQFTVRDLFAKAAHPERIFAGICWQADPEADRDCFIVDPPYPDHVRSLRFLPWESKGGCWARAKALSLAQNEDYVLQIDAHMRFMPGWDNDMIEILNRCPSPKAALSTCPAPYTPPNNIIGMEGHLTVTLVTQAAGVNGMQPISLGGNRRPLSHIRMNGPLPTPFITANFLFGPRQMFQNVPCDPYLFFRGQESTYSLRLWTHGYNVYQPDKNLLHHYWDSKTRNEKGEKDVDYKSSASEAALAARERVWHILGLKPAENPESLIEINRYGLGQTRTPASFWAFSGVNIHTGHVEEFAQRGYWPYPPAA